EYTSLASAMDPNDPVHIEVLNKIKKRLRSDTFTREYILEIIKMYPDLIRLLYINFALTHYVNPRGAAL
ncbi:2147_t:CDS:1, partial [Racocetra fulgida]